MNKYDEHMVNEAKSRVYDEWRQDLFNGGDAPMPDTKLPNGNWEAVAFYWEEKARAIWEDAYVLAGALP